MSLIKTYLDTGIYIIPLRNKNPLATARALQLINSPHRARVTSDVLRLELLPNSLRRHDLKQINQINGWINQAPEFIRLDDTIINLAIAEQAAVKDTLGIADLLHITIAKQAGCADFITTELPGSPLYQFAGINIVTF